MKPGLTAFAYSAPQRSDTDTQMLTSLNLSHKLVIIFGAMSSIVGITLAVIYADIEKMVETDHMVTHTYQVVGAVDGAVAAMVNQETGLRGYLLAGEDKFLEPFKAGASEYSKSFAQAKQLTSDNAAQQRRLQELARLAAEWQALAQNAIQLMAAPATREEGRQIEIKAQGKTAMDGFRAKAAEIKQVELDLLDARVAAGNAASSQARQIALGGGILLVVVAIAAGVLLYFNVGAPLINMTASMRRLADGETGIEIPGGGRTDEVGAMAGAVRVFKENMVRARELEAESAAAKAEAEADRKRQMHNIADKFEHAVGGIVRAVSDAERSCNRRLRRSLLPPARPRSSPPWWRLHPNRRPPTCAPYRLQRRNFPGRCAKSPDR
jgi:methyl-accepting chemotaxis protein